MQKRGVALIAALLILQYGMSSFSQSEGRTGKNNNCRKFSEVNFTSGWDIWNDGGSDCAKLGNKIRLRDNSGMRSSIYTDNIDFSTVDQVVLNFSFVSKSMESGENFFLEVSTDGGNHFIVIQEWISGQEFANGVQENPSVLIRSEHLSANSVIRFRCDASNNFDRIILDNIVLETCGTRELDTDTSEQLVSVEKTYKIKDKKDIDLSFYPNPASDFLNVELDGYANEKISIIEFVTSFGTRLQTIENVNDYNCKLSLEELKAGKSYLMILTTESGEILVEKFAKV